ncbi:class I glutamine amidotransferase-like protein [Lentithecium fluviatile CBS 122367]|uniref:Class I glutamine amidotransferase-like protein n=1 Tax=Lentithecium fluviatile CBS 122367 TaxID=1168545 RepID=A0A6G1ILX8_9PLEO|nr:class I glutamine amidotransferase-like protein [Lentithecium fluviatile CBS 122367]
MATTTPKSYGVILYPGFQLTDICGPVDVLNVLSTHTPNISLSLVAETLGPISTSPTTWPSNTGMPPFTTAQSMLATHTFATAPQFDVLIIPGGMGCFDPSAKGQPNPSVVDPIVAFVRKQYPGLQYLLTVCTGSGIASISGLLDGKKATTFKGAWGVIPAWRPQVQWVPKARWVVDGNIWSSSGVSSGTDLMFGFVERIYGEEVAKEIAVWMEYIRHRDADDDPFGIVV